MNDAELRALVREAVARHLRGHGSTPVAEPPAGAPAAVSWAGHPSHFQYVTVINADEACVIEPTVACNHCGYCKSHGH